MDRFTDKTEPPEEGPGVVFKCQAPYIAAVNPGAEQKGEIDPGSVVPPSIQNQKLPNSPQPSYTGIR